MYKIPILFIFTYLLACGRCKLQTNYAFDPEYIELILNGIIECTRGVLKEGVEELGIPTFNPLVIGDHHIVLDNTFVTGNIYFQNMKLDGLPNFVVNQLKVIVAPIALKYKYSSNVTLTGDYAADGTFLGRPHFSKSGSFNLNTIAEFSGVVEFSNTNGLNVDNFNIYPKVDPNFSITGLDGNETVIIEVLEKIVNQINENQETINGILGPFLMEYANKLIDLEVTGEIGEILELIIRKCPDTSILIRYANQL